MIRIIFITLFLVLANCTISSAQEVYTKKTAPKKAMKLYSKAKGSKYASKPAKKEEALVKLLTLYPGFIEPHVDLAYMYYRQELLAKARKKIEQAIQLDPDYKADYYLILANYCKEDEDIDCEVKNLGIFVEKSKSEGKISKVKTRLANLQLKKQINKDYEEIDLEKLPAAINSAVNAQYKPVLNVEGNHMVFTRLVKGQEDFYESRKLEGEWQVATAITELNTSGNEGAHAVSPDGKWMIFTQCQAPNRYKSCDLYIAKSKDGKWVNPQYMSIVNTTSWESEANFSADGNTIYFTSAREGGIGGRDIYYVERVDGKWSSPKNMGDIINTSKSEESPFLHPDGRTMYFMSNGHPGLGGKDLFITRKNMAGIWSTPVNMGPAINSSKDEGGLFVDVNGEYAYFSKSEKVPRESKSDAYQKSDITSSIYRFKMPDEFRPTPVTFVKLRVKDGQTGEYISTRVSIMEQAVNKEVYETIPTDGKIVIIERAKKYALTIDKENYIFHSERIDFDEMADKNKPLIYEIDLFPIPKTLTKDTLPPISLNNINFRSGEATLLAGSYYELDKLWKLMFENNAVKILLNGYTDNVGNAEDNVILSRERAEAVASYLQAKDIKRDRITIQAFGESQPLMTNESEVGRAKNRRIEFQVIYAN